MARKLLFVRESAPKTAGILAGALRNKSWEVVDPTSSQGVLVDANPGAVGLAIWQRTVGETARHRQSRQDDFFRSLAALLRSGAERFVLLAPGAGEDWPWDGTQIPSWQQWRFRDAFTVCSVAGTKELLHALNSARVTEQHSLRSLMAATARILPKDSPDVFLLQVSSQYQEDEGEQRKSDVARAFGALSEALGLTLGGNPGFEWKNKLTSIGLGDYVKDLVAEHLLCKLAEVTAQPPFGSAQDLATEHQLARNLEAAIQKRLNPEGVDGALTKAAVTRRDDELTKAAVTLRLVELLRDVGSCLSAGAGPWARRELGSRPLRVLLVDDQPERIRRLLECALRILGPPGAWLCIASEECWRMLKETVEGWSDGSRTVGSTPVGGIHSSALRGETGHAVPRGESETLDQYDLILIDVEFDGRALGASIVRRISTWLDAVKGDRPRVMVLSLSKDTEQIQQALNLGAEAYILKERVFQLPAVLAGGRRRSQSPEPRGSRSAFRSLYRLPPRLLAGLQGTSACTGSLDEAPQQRVPSAPATTANGGYDAWVKALPKADLHHHIGTCISLETIEAQAWNTVGYLHEGKGKQADWLTGVAKRVWATVLKARKKMAKGRSAAEALWIASLDGRGSDQPEDRPIDKVIESLVLKHRPIRSFEVTALFVAVLSLAGGGPKARRRWEELATLDALAGEGDGFGDRTLLDVGLVVDKIVREWEQPYTSRKVSDTFSPGWNWKSAVLVIKKRVAVAHGWLSKIGRQAGWDGRPTSLPSLQEIVRLPAKPKTAECTLGRYLWGTGLLGSAHLQVPENLVLAAVDLVRQAAEDNVVYSEVRCATTGYTEGGMSAVLATDLLCASLDLAAAHSGLCGEPRRWVRFNVLLAGKRDKPNDFEKAVALLGHYLQQGRRGGEFGGDDPGSRPAWWKPCGVVGFDLSGDEKIEAEKFKGRIGPLFERCAAITIHAGEAASAESIWQAVYMLGARRIGHGLRLWDKKKLLDYCITEGICMEMCPISNRFTGDFKPPESGTDNRYAYPLRHYLDEGLEVCIGTDNRFLHDRHTLTDEYMVAAELVGGLTKWELLKLVKAGFKHAFLPKSEVKELLRAVEEEVYDLVMAGAESG